MNEIDKKIETLKYYGRLLEVIEGFETERQGNTEYYENQIKEIEQENENKGITKAELENNWRYQSARESLSESKEKKNIIATIRAAILKLAT